MTDEQEIPHGYCHCGCGGLTRISTNTSRKYGSVRGQPRRYINHHYNRPPMDRFMEKVEKTESCWIWKGAKGPDGNYGGFLYEGKSRRVNIVSYLMFKGPYPEGMEICHTCDNKQCVNPDHLFVGTRSDNMKDMGNKGRHPWQLRPELVRKGEDNPGAKLAENDVLLIVSRFKNGESVASIARDYPVNREAISKIVRGQNWNWLTKIKASEQG